MNYEQKYKEALERARQFSEHPLQEDRSSIVEYIFPELKESEDEKIRKALIKYCKLQQKENNIGLCGISLIDIITWLEKVKADTIRTLFGDVFDKHNDCEHKTCRTCKHRERWALSDWSNKVVQCCNLQPSKRSNSGYKTIKVTDKACENYESD